MKKLLLILTPFVITACNGDKPTATDSIEEVKEVVKTEPDITMSAADLSNNTLKNETFVTDRIGKRINLTNVTIGGSENLGGGQVNLWGNDGDVHWNGQFMCCRYIFKVTDQQQIRKAEMLKQSMATITATLVDYRETQNTPPYSNTPVRLKEFIFEDVVITEDHIINQTEKEKLQASNETKNGEIEGAEQADGLVAAVVISEKAFFYEKEDTTTKKDSNLLKGDEIKYKPGSVSKFVFATFKIGDITVTGWLLKSDISDN